MLQIYSTLCRGLLLPIEHNVFAVNWEASLIWMWCRMSTWSCQMYHQLDKCMRTFDHGWCRKPYGNLLTNSVQTQRVRHYVPIPVLLCVFSKSNWLHRINLLLPSFPSCPLSHVGAVTLAVGSPWLAEPTWLFRQDTGTLTHRDILALSHLGASHTWGCLRTLCFILHHGLLYVTAQSFCNCFVCWPAGEGPNLIRRSVLIISSGKGLYHWIENVLLTFSSILD